MSKLTRPTRSTVRTLLSLALTGGIAIFVLILAVQMGESLLALVAPEEAVAAPEMTSTPTATGLPEVTVAAPPATETTVPATPVPATPQPTPTERPTSIPPTPVPPQPRLVVEQNRVNLRRGPSTAYGRMGFLQAGMELPVTGWMGEWWRVEVEGETGFVFGEFVTVFEREAAPELTWADLPGPELGEPVFVPAPTWAINEERWIDVDLSEQRVTAYEGQTPVKSYLVSTGLPQTPTPEGQFRIWIKFRYDDMEGDDYYLEDVPWVMYFYQGYGFHGVWWHANWGSPMSHGCINQPNEMAEWLFEFAEVGTLVNVHE